jgi:hypothetical protein
MGVNSRWVGRFDADGGFIGSEVLGPGVGDAVEAAPGGGAVVAGFAGDSFTTAVIWAGAYDATGAFAGEMLGASGEADRARAIVIADEATMFAAGNRGTDINNLADLVVDGVDVSGFTELLRVAPKAGVADAQAIAIGNGDDLFVGGYLQVAVMGPDAGPRDAYVARITQAGDVVWTDVHGTAATEYSDEVEAIAIAPNEDVVVAGFLNAGTAEASDLWVRRYTADGDVRWDATIDVGVAEILRGIAFSPGGQLAVAGEVQGDDGYRNLWVARVAP